MSQYSEHYWKINIYKRNFEKILDSINTTDDFNEKLNLAIYASKYFVYHNTGYFTSSVLERFFLKCAKTIHLELHNIQYKKDSILHVLTNGYETGGHTRVVERWIKNASPNQVHSVLQTKQTGVSLSVLRNIVKEHNGNFIVFSNKLSITEKAIELRKLGMKYEYVVLHTHMEDPIPIIAFGTDDFTRPVLLYNHASHMPWLGKSVADVVLDIEKGDQVTSEKRKISNTFFLGVPSKSVSIEISDKNKERFKLNIPVDKKVIVTSGMAMKYRNISGKSFIDYLIDIMDDNTYCYVIGVEKNNKEWKKSILKSGKKIFLLGVVDFNKGYLNYLKAADLYLDSYPVGGGTATIDAIASGTPALSLQSVYPQFDYLIKTSAYCKTGKEFIQKAKQILCDKEYAAKVFSELRESLVEHQSVAAWNKRMKELCHIVPERHKINNLNGVVDYSKPNDLSVLTNTICNEKFIKIKRIRKISDKKLNMIKHKGRCKRLIRRLLKIL